MTYTPGRALFEWMRDGEVKASGVPAEFFATWDRLAPEKRERMADAGRAEIAAYMQAREAAAFLADAASLDTDPGDSRDVLDRALSIAAHEAAFETAADAGGERERWLKEARLQEATIAAEAGK